MKTLVELSQVNFHYPGGPQVLDKVNLKLHEGDFIALTGPNGSAKTTLLKLILGSLKPQGGTIKLFGLEIAAFKDWYKIGYVPQKTNFFNPSFPASVQEIIWLNKSGSSLLRGKRKLQNEIGETLKAVGLPGIQLKKIGELSGGELQRVLIARALINRPKILILDEPTANLDKLAQDNLCKLLARLNTDMGLSVLLVTHDEKIKGKANQVLELVAGKLQAVEKNVS